MFLTYSHMLNKHQNKLNLYLQKINSSKDKA